MYDRPATEHRPAHQCARCGDEIEPQVRYKLVRRPWPNRVYYTPVRGHAPAQSRIAGWTVMNGVWPHERVAAQALYRRVALEPRYWRGEEFHHLCFLAELKERTRRVAQPTEVAA